MTVKKDKVVEMHYTLKNETGDVLDSSKGQAPMPFLQGHGSGLKVRMYPLALILVRKAHISINYKHFSLCCIIVAFFKNIISQTIDHNRYSKIHLT
jgi:hypothetical protein